MPLFCLIVHNALISFCLHSTQAPALRLKLGWIPLLRPVQANVICKGLAC